MADNGGDERSLRRLRKRLAEDVLVDDYPLAEIDDELRAAGADPDAIGRRFATLVRAKIDDHRRVAWRDGARADLDRARRALSNATASRLPRNRTEALHELTRLRADPRAGGVISAAFRKKGPGTSSEDELIQLVADVHKLLAIPDDGLEES